MKSHDELMTMTDKEREKYLSDEVQVLLDRVEDGPRKMNLARMQWRLLSLKRGKYKNDPEGYQMELRTQMMSNLSAIGNKFKEIVEIANKDK